MTRNLVITILLLVLAVLILKLILLNKDQTPTITPPHDYIAYYKFDGSAESATGSHNASCPKENCPKFVDDELRGKVVQFGSDTNYLDISPFDFSGTEVTISLWFNLQTINGCGPRFISKANGANENEHWLMLGLCDTIVRVRLKTIDGKTTTIVGAKNVGKINAWQNIALTYNGSDIVIYNNGEIIQRVSQQGAIATDSVIPVWIGNNPVRNAPFYGKIDDLMIFKRALSPREIEALYLSQQKPLNR